MEITLQVNLNRNVLYVVIFKPYKVLTINIISHILLEFLESATTTFILYGFYVIRLY